eukprot:7281971-Prymnesium_polylepis.1
MAPLTHSPATRACWPTCICKPHRLSFLEPPRPVEAQQHTPRQLASRRHTNSNKALAVPPLVEPVEPE